MKLPACIPATLLLAARLAAQEGAPPGRELLPTADSSRVSALEEQITGVSEDEEVAREEVSPAPRRRAAGWRVSWKLRAGATLQEAAGYSRRTYAGDRTRISQKLTVRHGEAFSAEFLTDKDPGEARTADFVSGSVSFRLFDGGMRIVAGDFRMRAGQGLLFGSPRSFGKGSAVIEPALRGAWGVPEGVSSDETHFLRGGAIQAEAGPVSLVAFGSVRRISPMLAADGSLRGVDASGYHRTAAEIARRGTLGERSAGGAMRIRVGDRLTIGGNFQSTLLGMTGGGAGSGGTVGAAVRRASVDARATIGGLTLFGEGIPSGPGTAWIAGAVLTDSSGGRIVVARRFYPPADWLHGTYGFGDGSGGSNEEGTYVGAESPIGAALLMSAYLDLYSKPAPVQGLAHPPSGADRLVAVRCTPTPALTLEARFRSRLSDIRAPGDGSGGSGAPGTGPGIFVNAVEHQRRSRISARWVPASGVSCGLMFDHCAVSAGGGAVESGAMATADLAAEPWKGMTIDIRTRFFRSDSYASGIPSVDVDLPGTLTANVNSGEGAAWAAGWTWRWSPHVRLEISYSILRRDDLPRIGSGASELPSNIREKAGFQLDIVI